MIDKIFYMDKTSNFAEVYTSETSLGDFADVGETASTPRPGCRRATRSPLSPPPGSRPLPPRQEMVEDAKIGKIKSRANIFTTSYNRTREKFAASLLIGGLGETVTLGEKSYSTKSADNMPLFSSAHPSITDAGFTQSNRFTNEFSLEVLDAMQEAMQDFRDDDGTCSTWLPTPLSSPTRPRLKRAVLRPSEASSTQAAPTMPATSRLACGGC